MRRALAPAIVVAAATSAAAAADPCDASLRVDASAGALIDACGRQRYFRGINSVYKAPPWVAPADTFTGDGNSLSPVDGALFASLGWNALRLGTMWAGVAPAGRGSVNSSYLAALVGISSALYTDNGVWSLLDAHQDLFSARFCADGAPGWAAAAYTVNVSAANGFPAPLAAPYAVDPATGTPSGADCGRFGWGDYYATYAVGAAFQALYNTSAGIADFSAFWAAVVGAYAAVPGVLGYELLNEPWAGDALRNPLLMVPGVADAVNLQPFYGEVAAAIRAAEAAAGVKSPRPVFAEPVTWDNFVPAGFTALPGAADGLAGLSVHYYSLPDIIGAGAQIADRAADAARLKAVAFLTEFDLDLPSPVDPPYGADALRATLDDCDAHRVGYLGWAYQSVYTGAPGSGQLVTAAVREMARPLPFAVAGTNASWAFNATLQTFDLTYTTVPPPASSPDAGAPTVVFLSTGFWFPAAQLNVAVASAPAGAVTWSLEHVNGTAVPVAGFPPTVPASSPFAYARLVVAPVPGAPPGAVVSVHVDAYGRGREQEGRD
jgi:endoglycosylceramidase